MSAARCLVVVVALGFIVSAAWAVAPPAGATVDQGTRQVVVERLDQMPLLFVPEPISPDGAMGFAVRGQESSIWLSETGIVYRLQKGDDGKSKEDAGSWVVALDLVGATPRQPVGEGPLPTRVSYFKGPKAEWRTGLPSYGSVRYREPWPGIDVVVSGTAGELESTFVVGPGADPGRIHLAYRGASALRLAPDGSLVVDTPLGSITEQAPVAYQEISGQRVKVAAAFELEPGTDPDRQSYGFRIGDYDRARELVVDPVTLVYCGYIGGSTFEDAYDIAVDADGNAYVVGGTNSTQATFPVTVGPDLTHNGGTWDAFVAKVNADGTGLDYCGYIGGTGNDAANDIAVDPAGNAYVTGFTESTEASFPVTVGPDLTHNGGDRDAFVARVSATGYDLDYCGYIGGSGFDSGTDIAVDPAGNAYVAGDAGSTQASFPVTVGPDLTYNGGDSDAFVAKVRAAGTGLDYCGYIGGSDRDGANGIAVDPEGNAYVTGSTRSTEASFPVTVGPDLTYNGGDSDAFVATVRAAGTGLDYCGYIGGSGNEVGYGIAIAAAGNAYVAGFTPSTEASFPVAAGPDLTYNGGYWDAFVAKVNVAGTGLDYCGYIGGSEIDWAGAIAVDPEGNAYVTGGTWSTEATFPVAVGPDLTYNGGTRDAFVARVRAAGTGLDYCGYVGGSGSEWGSGIAIDAARHVYVAGRTSSTETDFPVAAGPDLTYNGGDRDGFVAKLDSSDFFLSAMPSAFEICAGSDAEYTVTVGALGGFDDDVILSASGNPPGTSAEFSVNPVTPPGSSVLTIGNTGGAVAGSYVITVTGTADGSGDDSVDVTLDVVVPAPPPLLTAPPDGAIGQPMRPLFQWAAAVGASSYRLEVDDEPSFSDPEIYVSGIIETSYPCPIDLEENTTYHWRVSSENLCGAGAPSPVFSFTTLDALPFADGFESGDTSAWSATVP